MTKIGFWGRLVCLAVLAGCEIAIEDGRVPPKYLEQAQQFVGHYVGEFNGHEGTVDIVLEDTNRPVVVTRGFNGGDLIAPWCHTSVQELIALGLEGEKNNDPGEVVSTRFAFDPGSCGWWMGGRSIDFGFWRGENGRIQMDAIIIYNVGTTVVKFEGELEKVD